MLWSTVVNFGKSALDGLASAMRSTGASVVWVESKGSLILCEPKSIDLCDFVLVKEVGVLGVLLAWLDYSLQWIKLIPKINATSQFRWLTRCHRAWNTLTDIIGMGSFLLLIQLGVFFEIKGRDYPLNQRSELLPMLMSSLLIAAVSNVNIRTVLLRRFGVVGQERHRLIKGLDGFFECLRGFSEGRALVLVCEAIYDQSHNTDLGRKVLSAEIARYAVGCSWAFFSSFMGYCYGPNLALADLFLDETLRLSIKAVSISLHDLLPVISFGFLMGTTIAKNVSPYKEILSGALAFLLPAIMFRSYYVHIRYPPQQALLPLQTSLLPDEVAHNAVNAVAHAVDFDTMSDQLLLAPTIAGSAIASMGFVPSASLASKMAMYQRLSLP